MSYINEHRGFGRYEYHPFGMMMQERSNAYGDYRFGFNGGEEINEIIGEGNYVDLGERGVDTRLGRLNWSIDPRASEYPWQSPYAYYANSPIWQIDFKGEGAGDYFDKEGNHLGNDGIDDGKVFVVDGASKFSESDFQQGGKHHNNQSDYNKNNGDGYSVNEVGADTDLGKMIRTVYAEAAGQGAESKLAVAEVIRNRANDNTAPSSANKYTAQFSGVDTYSEVVEQKGQFESVAKGAARYTNPLSVTSGNPIEQKAFLGSAGAAIKAHYQNTNTASGALFFYSPYIKPPNWTSVLKQVNVSGVSNSNFRFYKYK